MNMHTSPSTPAILTPRPARRAAARLPRWVAGLAIGLVVVVVSPLADGTTNEAAFAATPEAGLLFDGGFDADGLAGWTAQRAASDRIQVVASPTDGSPFSARFEVRPGDKVAAGAGTGNRAELYSRGWQE